MTMELWAAAAQLLDSFCANHFCCHTITNKKNPIINSQRLSKLNAVSVSSNKPGINKCVSACVDQDGW